MRRVKKMGLHRPKLNKGPDSRVEKKIQTECGCDHCMPKFVGLGYPCDAVASTQLLHVRGDPSTTEECCLAAFLSLQILDSERMGFACCQNARQTLKSSSRSEFETRTTVVEHRRSRGAGAFSPDQEEEKKDIETHRLDLIEMGVPEINYTGLCPEMWVPFWNLSFSTDKMNEKKLVSKCPLWKQKTCRIYFD